MARNDDIMDDMVSSDQPLVPRIDRHKGQQRWGSGVPLEIEPRKLNPNDPSSLDPENVRWWAEMNPVVGVLSGGEKMVNQGEWVEGGLLIAGSIIPANTVIKLFGPAVKMGRRVIGKTINGKYVSREKYENWVDTLNEAEMNLKLDRFEIDREAALMRQRTARGAQDEIAMAGEARKQLTHQYVRSMDDYTKQHRNLMKFNDKKVEATDAIYKAEEYMSRNSSKVKDVYLQRMYPNNPAMVIAHKKAYLLQEAVKDKFITPKQAEIYRIAEFGDDFRTGLYSQYKDVISKKDVSYIRNEVKKSLDAEEFRKVDLDYEIK
jgi:hypothetical protein